MDPANSINLGDSLQFSELNQSISMVVQEFSHSHFESYWLQNYQTLMNNIQVMSSELSMELARDPYIASIVTN